MLVKTTKVTFIHFFPKWHSVARKPSKLQTAIFHIYENRQWAREKQQEETSYKTEHVPSWCLFWPVSPSLVPACGRSEPRDTAAWRSTGSDSALLPGRPGGGTHRAAYDWCTRSPGHMGFHLLAYSYSVVSQTDLQWRSAPCPPAGSPWMHEKDVSCLRTGQQTTLLCPIIAYKLTGCSASWWQEGVQEAYRHMCASEHTTWRGKCLGERVKEDTDPPNSTTLGILHPLSGGKAAKGPCPVSQRLHRAQVVLP